MVWHSLHPFGAQDNDIHLLLRREFNFFGNSLIVFVPHLLSRSFVTIAVYFFFKLFFFLLVISSVG